MTLRLIREPSAHGATHGVLFVDHRFFCFALEDEIRDVPGEPVASWKVKGATAIPVGRYAVVLTLSQRFKRSLPLLLEVPGFSGIRIHNGNSDQDTSGCILLGRTRGETRIGESVLALNAFLERMRQASGPTWITIENPPVEAGRH